MSNQTKICIPIVSADPVQRTEDIHAALEITDCLELRLDRTGDIAPSELESLIGQIPQSIVTCRIAAEKGIDARKQRELLTAATQLGSRYIDIEHDSPNLDVFLRNQRSSKIILSYHNFSATPSARELDKLYAQFQQKSPDLIKMVPRANSLNDCFRIFDLLADKDDLIAFCLGNSGMISRILAPKYGSRITYASLTPDRTSADGQITAAEMVDLYRVPQLHEKTQCLGVIGAQAHNSRSKLLHNPLFADYDLPYVFLPLQVSPADLPNFMKNFRAYDFLGAAVTIPHKEAVTPFLDELDENARNIGAVNTILNVAGELVGFNTDVTGAILALKNEAEIEGTRALVMGAGGAARAIVYGLRQAGAEVTVVNRTHQRAAKLAAEFSVAAGDWQKLGQLVASHEIIINATSVGMAPNHKDKILSDGCLQRDQLVMDIVYHPLRTTLIRQAEQAGCPTITGEKMLIYQALQQFLLWTGIEVGYPGMESYFYL